MFGGVRTSRTNSQDRTSESGREIHVIGSDGRGERVLSSVGSDLYPVGWTSDGRAALIVSSRSNTTGLWAFPVSNGLDDDEPRLIKRDLNGELTDIGSSEGFSVIGTTLRGDLYFQTGISRSDIYMARLDPATGRATSAAMPVNTSRGRGPTFGQSGRPTGSASCSSGVRRDHRIVDVHTGGRRRTALPRLALDPFGVCWVSNNAIVSDAELSDTPVARVWAPRAFHTP